MESDGPSKSAPWISIPEGNITTVEHPCHIKHDVGKAIAMIGGGTAISEALHEDSDKTLALSFRPDDPAARTIIAHKKPANNILLQISTPRRTGRKRKRGSDGPWLEADEAETSKRDAACLVRSMQDNPTSYRVNALGPITNTHVWRSMPDFAYSTKHIQSVQDVKSTLLTQSYPTIKEFKLPITHGLEDTTTLPPAIWSQVAIPQTYSYRQNPSVKIISDPNTGTLSMHNTQAPPKVYSYQMQWDDPEYPKAPDPRLAPLADQAKLFQDVTKKLHQLFDERPIWTRRALLNVLQSEISSFNVVRFCLAYVAFAMRSGPWRDTYIRLGVDPRSDKSCRVYQTIMLQLVPKETQAMRSAIYRKHTVKNRAAETGTKESQTMATDPTITAQVAGLQKLAEERKTYARFWARSNDVTSHVFDGVTSLPKDGKIWQLCDITDPQLTRLRDLPEDKLRQECENRYFGWYHNGTCAKMRIVLKAKADALQKGNVIDTDLIEPLLHLPEDVYIVAEAPKDQAGGSDMDPNHAVEDRAPNETQKLDSSQSAPCNEVTETPNSTAQAIDPQSAASGEKSGAVTLSHEIMVAMMGPPLTKEQYAWLGFYRAYSRTEPGQKPCIGVPPILDRGDEPKDYPSRPYNRGPRNTQNKGKATPHKRGSKAGSGSRDKSQTARPGPGNRAETEGQPETTIADFADGADNSPSSPSHELDEGRGVTPTAEMDPDIMPSIEFNGFDDEDEDNSELGLDIDAEIKLEPEDEVAWMAANAGVERGLTRDPGVDFEEPGI